jgi:hypothetical protein
MDELEWNTSTNLYKMLKYCNISKRKGRLLGCAVFRKHWNELTDECKKAIELAELYADGKTTDNELHKMRRSILITDATTGSVTTLVSLFNRKITSWFVAVCVRPYVEDGCDLLRHMVKYRRYGDGLVEM